MKIFEFHNMLTGAMRFIIDYDQESAYRVLDVLKRGEKNADWRLAQQFDCPPGTYFDVE